MNKSHSHKSEDEGTLELHLEARMAVQSQYEIDAAIEKHATRKFDVDIVLWLFGIW
jgi:hypothetical protein